MPRYNEVPTIRQVCFAPARLYGCGIAKSRILFRSSLKFFAHRLMNIAWTLMYSWLVSSDFLR